MTAAQALAGASRRLQAALETDPAAGARRAQQAERLDTAVYFLEAVLSSVIDAHLSNSSSQCPAGMWQAAPRRLMAQLASIPDQPQV